MITMDTNQIIIAIAFGAVLLAAIGQTSDYFKSKSKDRRKKTHSEALLNNRIINAFDNEEYRVVSVLEQEGGFFDWEGETVKSFNRAQKSFLNCHPDQFKEALVKGLVTGKHVYRFFPSEIIDVSNVASAISNEYTNEELRRMSEQAFKDQTTLEGEIAILKANEEERVSSTIAHAKEINTSKFGGGN